MTSFAELDISFPLFEAPVEDSSNYIGVAGCDLCNAANVHCFELGIGCDVIASCSACGAETALDAHDRKAGLCTGCATEVAFPDSASDRVRCCCSCLRAGKAAIAKDSVLGAIGYAEAVEGVTHGLPSLERDEFEIVPKGDDWFGARVPKADLFELVRTPRYLTIQGDQWQFCCARPMTFLGTWTADHFNRAAENGDGRALFDAIVPDANDDLWNGNLHDEAGIYVFRCRACSAHAAHWDMS